MYLFLSLLLVYIKIDIRRGRGALYLLRKSWEEEEEEEGTLPHLLSQSQIQIQI